MIKLIKKIKLFFSKRKELKELKMLAINSIYSSIDELNCNGLPSESKEEITNFLLISQGEPAESILFYNNLFEKLSAPRAAKTFNEIRNISLDLYFLTENEYILWFQGYPV